MAFDFSFSSGGAGYGSPSFGASYTNNAFTDFFYFGSTEELIIFVAVFMIGFIVSFIGLKKFFSKRLGQRIDPTTNEIKGAKTVVKNMPALIIISLCISILMTLGIAKSGWLFYYFGAAAGILWFVMVGGIFIMILMAMFKFVALKFGGSVGVVTFIILIWLLLKYFIVERLHTLNLPEQVIYYMQSLTDVWALAAGIVAGIVITQIGLSRSYRRFARRARISF